MTSLLNWLTTRSTTNGEPKFHFDKFPKTTAILDNLQKKKIDSYNNEAEKKTHPNAQQGQSTQSLSFEQFEQQDTYWSALNDSQFDEEEFLLQDEGVGETLKNIETETATTADIFQDYYNINGIDVRNLYNDQVNSVNVTSFYNYYNYNNYNNYHYENDDNFNIANRNQINSYNLNANYSNLPPGNVTIFSNDSHDLLESSRNFSSDLPPKIFGVEDDTDDNWFSLFIVILKGFIFCSIILTAVLGNALVIISVQRNRKLR